ncbi:STAS domain protein [Streptomyces sp. YIM 130001]|uniref:STAS domain-containing protein n=1 Tax=Streptomyces sp. YIM 130001 TaxID=2259644 RepID=UPI000E650959|nr:STAS domain-containing protein [Streptomyces sp. YIM 130001]RII13694.1 STAS domain protein [Streptomyces sp. YIM 130001]
MGCLSVRQASPDCALFCMFAFSGELDVTSVGTFADTVVRSLEQGGRHFCLDLSGLTWCDNGSLFTLLGIRNAANHAGGSLSCTAVSTPVREALYRTGLNELLPVVPG